MLKKIIFLLFISFASLSQGESKGYEVISPAQPTQNQDKIEVIEFFWYGCPSCYSLEPSVIKWLETLPENVEFIRQPTIFNTLWEKHAKAYYVAEALDIVEKVHADFFDVIQNKKKKLATEDELAKFFKRHGVEDEKFRSTYNSFLVDAKLRQAKNIARRYGVTGVPALVVNGKYKTNGPLAKSQDKMFAIVDELIAMESKK